MDFERLKAKLTELEGESIDEAGSILNKPYSSFRFPDQVSGKEKARSISVLGSDSDPEHPFKGRLVGGCGEGQESDKTTIDEDYVTQIAREFAEFLQNKEAVEEVATPAAQPQAAPQAQAAMSAQQPKINPIATQLSKLLGIQNTSQLVTAYKAPKPSAQQLAILAQAFKQLAAADPQTTTKAMMLLKKISAEEPME